MIEHDVETIARTIYESTEEILAQSLWPGWKLTDFAVVDERTRHIHHVMARAVISLLTPPASEISPAKATHPQDARDQQILFHIEGTIEDQKKQIADLTEERDAALRGQGTANRALAIAQADTEEEFAKSTAAEAKAETLARALNWYEGEASALNRYALESPANTTAMAAVMQVLSLDGGKRARMALATVKAARMVRHLKRGGIFEVLGEAIGQVSTNADGTSIGLGLVRGRIATENAKLTIYRDPKDGRLFWRFPDEFEDGRFVDINTQETK